MQVFFGDFLDAQLAGVITNETGSGALVFATGPTLVAPILGTPASGAATNLTGTASGLTAGTGIIQVHVRWAEVAAY